MGAFFSTDAPNTTCFFYLKYFKIFASMQSYFQKASNSKNKCLLSDMHSLKLTANCKSKLPNIADFNLLILTDTLLSSSLSCDAVMLVWVSHISAMQQSSKKTLLSQPQAECSLEWLRFTRQSYKQSVIFLHFKWKQMTVKGHLLLFAVHMQSAQRSNLLVFVQVLFGDMTLVHTRIFLQEQQSLF